MAPARLAPDPPPAEQDGLEQLSFPHAQSPPGAPNGGSNGACASSRCADEPLAIVGVAFKFPAEASSSRGFWEMLMHKRNAMSEWPADRFNVDAFYHPDSSRPDTIDFRGGHFLNRSLTGFDAPFFSITGAEAEAMDPQHRLALETTFHALENAGIPLELASGSQTSVHAGCFADDYKTMSSHNPQNLPSHVCTGVAMSMLSNRVSWFFNLLGASITMDTACSSSMIAFDMACQGLRNGNADVGLVVGANLMFGVEMCLNLSRMNFVSPDSKCFAFDSRANGYGRGEGVGVLVVKRLSDALRANDTIRAVVRSTGSNQDGRTPGITQPNPVAQEQLIKATYAKAGLDMSLTRYVEAHGTGTAIGDPTEALAIGNAFKDYRTANEPMYIGSVKGNIGHLEGTSGIAGIIKTIHLLEQGVIVPQANFETLNPRIDSDALRIKVPKEVLPWPTDGLRRASISSFGFGGANSHVVLDDAYNFLRLHGLQGNHLTSVIPPDRDSQSTKYFDTVLGQTMRGLATRARSTKRSYMKKLLVWSAADQNTVKRMLTSFGGLAGDLSHLSDTEVHSFLESLAYTLSNRRSHLQWRTFAVVDSLHTLADVASSSSKPLKRLPAPKLGFVFTGQGAQYAGMGKELLQFSVFQNSLRRSEMFLEDLGCQWSIIDEITKPTQDSRVDEPAFSQPLCTALQIAIIDLLYSLGVTPSLVLGHSSGEIAAAYAIGGLSHQSACKVAYFRGRCAHGLLRSQTKPYGMLSVGLSDQDIAAYFDQLRGRFGTLGVTVACINSPNNITVSGESDQIDWLKNVLEDVGVFARRLRVNIAYHSPQMEQVVDEYARLMGHLEPDHRGLEGVPMVSSVTGSFVDVNDLADGEYWVRNMARPVRFSDALGKVFASKKSPFRSLGSKAPADDLLEIGPHAALRGPIQDTLRHHEAQKTGYFSALTRSTPADDSLLDLTGSLFCRGYALDISKLNEGTGDKPGPRMVLSNLPEYPFDHSRDFWKESRSSKEGYRERRYARLDLLGNPVADWNPLEARWKNHLRISEQPWMAHHKVKGTVLFPATGMLAMALEGAKQLGDAKRTVTGYTLSDVVFSKVIALPEDDGGKEVEIVLRPLTQLSRKDADAWDFALYAADQGGEWQAACTGTVAVSYEKKADAVDAGREALALRSGNKQKMDLAQTQCTQACDMREFYRFFDGMGIEYGPSFQNVTEAKYDGRNTGLAKVATYRWPTGGKSDFPQPHIIHPATLDSMMHTALVCTSEGLQKSLSAMLPTRLGKLWIRPHGASYPSIPAANVHVQGAFRSRQNAEINLSVTDPLPEDVILSISDLEVKAISFRDSPSDSMTKERSLCYEMFWKPDVDMLDPVQLSAYCEKARLPRDNESSFYEKISLLLMKYLSDLLDAVPADGWARLPSHFERYMKWASHSKEAFEQGSFEHMKPTSDVWKALKSDPNFQSELERSLELNGQGEFFVEIGTRLLKFVNGEIDPLQYMFQEGAVSKFYREVNETVICYEPLGQYLDILTHKIPSLKILEVGAGTGASTDHVLDMLTRDASDELAPVNFSQYDFTDISPAFFEAATEKYAKHGSRMNFFVFDAEKDPSGQGIAVGSYDVVVAASVLHATRDLDVTMHNIRKLLKPGGKLVLFEPVKEVVRVGFIFGLLPGWWLGEDDARALRPWLHVDEWDGLMKRTGFSGVDMDIPDYDLEISHEYSILVSTATSDQTPMPDGVATPKNSLEPVSLVIGSSASQQSTAEALITAMQRLGYVCDIVPLDDLPQLQKFGQRHWICLCELDQPVLSELSEEMFSAFKRLLTTAQRVLWVTSGGGEGGRDPRYHVIDGLARTACTENFKLALSTLALASPENGSEANAEKIMRTYQTVSQQGSDDFELEYLEKDGLIHVNRVATSPPLEEKVIRRKDVERNVRQPFGDGPPLALQVGTIGLLDSLHFVEDKAYNEPLLPGYVEVKVAASGVNFRDCLIALGQIEDDTLGIECAGIVTKTDDAGLFKVGDRVAAVSNRAYQTYIRARVEQVVRLPDGVSLVEGSASLVVFGTAWHCLVEVARIREGESILIHSGAGGTGQAAIQVAKLFGAQVYTTVGSAEKKEFLMKTYGIPEHSIFYSRDTTFAQGVLRETAGRGVDVILNSLSGENLLASWDCIAPCGRFVEIGKRDILSRHQLPMWQFRNNCTFAAVDLSILMAQRPAAIKDAFAAAIDHIGKKTFFVPQPLRVLGVSEIQTAFQSFQGGSNYGKMVVQMRDEEPVDARLRPIPTYKLDPSRTYVISGGLGGLGRNLATWMYKRGARNLILLSRSGIKSEAARRVVDELSEAGVVVKTPICDISDQNGLSSVLEDAAKTLPPIAGCIQAAMVLKDSVLENMTFADWLEACKSKIQGSWNLHTLLPSGMDFFVCLSSLSCIMGSGGQANYAAGNTFMDELVRYRISRGEKGATINLGWVESEGAVAENAEIMSMFTKMESVSAVSLSDLHALLDFYCDPDTTSPHQIITGLCPPPSRTAQDAAAADQLWLRKRTFRHLLHAALHGSKEENARSTGTNVNYGALFKDAGSAEDAVQVVSLCLKNRLSKALSISPEDLDMSKPLHACGVDSLLAVELRNYLARQFDAEVAVFDIMGTKSVDATSALIAARSSIRDAKRA